MISLKIGGFIVAAFIAGSFVASPVPQAIAAVIATDVQCTGCVGTPDLANNSVTSAKIKDGEVKTDDIAPSAIGSLRIKDNDVKAQDLAPDSVGGSEIIGVTKLIFAECTVTNNAAFSHGSGLGGVGCAAQGAATFDNAVATLSGGNVCFGVTSAVPITNTVSLTILNHCSSSETLGTASVSVIVFDK